MKSKAEIQGWGWHADINRRARQGWVSELRDRDGHLLASIESRPMYCDRGHWKGLIHAICDLDSQDGWPNYYMSLDRAQAEIEAFLLWRLFHVRCQHNEV